MVKDLIEVDYMLIKQLRREGKYLEANELINAFNDSIQKEKKQILKEINKQDRKIKRHFKICIVNSCKNEAIEGKCYCEKHKKELLDYMKKYRVKKN